MGTSTFVDPLQNIGDSMLQENTFDSAVLEKDIRSNSSDEGIKAFTVSTSAYEKNGIIPVRYCAKGIPGGENISIPVFWNNIPKDTASLFLLFIDPHPVARNYIHWAVSKIPPSVNTFNEGISGTDKIPKGATELNNSSGVLGYYGPQPPEGTGAHPYTIHLFALNQRIGDFMADVSWDEINIKLTPITIASSKYVGYYGR